MKFQIFFIILALFFIPTACSTEAGQNPSVSLPEIPFVLSKEYKQAISESDVPKANEILEKFMKDWGLVGASIAVARNGKFEYVKSFGWADREQNIKATPQHLFRIASGSKLLTAAAIMKLVDQKKLKLNDKVFGKKGILNDEIFTKSIQNQKVTDIEVQHLLTHTAGWWNKFRADPMFLPLEIAESMKTAPPPDLNTITRFMVSQKKFFEAGTVFDYSNFGYCLLGKIIERKTGKPYEKYVQDEILKPLNINDMQIGKNSYSQKYSKEVRYYEQQNAPLRKSIDGKKDSVSRAYEGTNIELLGAAGGWVASPSDMLKVMWALDGHTFPPDLLNIGSTNRMKAQNDSLRTMGWRHCNETQCVRTGSLSGTQFVAVSQNDGISWVFVTNSSTWRAHYFSWDMIKIMNKVLQQLDLAPQAPKANLAKKGGTKTKK